MQPNKVQKTQNHHAVATAGNKGIPKSYSLLLRINIFIESVKRWEAYEKIDAIEGRANSVRHVPILKGVVRKGTDGQRLHEGSEV